MKVKKLLFVGDSPTIPTGFGRVTQSLLETWQNLFETTVFGINYNGFPHSFNYSIYPASHNGNPYGYSLLPSIIKQVNPDIIFLFNDIWVINNYINIISGLIDNKALIVGYTPIDGVGHSAESINKVNRCDLLATYTEFGKKQLGENVLVFPHGVDANIFYPMDKAECRKQLNIPEEGFIVLNANRNQPRKAIDTTIKAFCEFAQHYKDSYLYLHMGTKDAGWDIFSLYEREANKRGVSQPLLITSYNQQHPYVDSFMLNIIYNACDVGVNTSQGEGWGLVNMEHSLTGKPQILIDYAASSELYKNGETGVLIPSCGFVSDCNYGVERAIANPESLTCSLISLYCHEDERIRIGTNARNQFLSDDYNWEKIALNFAEKINELPTKNN